MKRYEIPVPKTSTNQLSKEQLKKRKKVTINTNADILNTPILSRKLYGPFKRLEALPIQLSLTNVSRASLYL